MRLETNVLENGAPVLRTAEMTDKDTTNAPPRLFVVEDDPTYASLMQRMAQAYGIHLDIFHPDSDFYNLPMDGDYDAAIVDCNLGNLNGLQIAALYSETPIMLMSAKNVADFKGPWPHSVRAFCSKYQGFSAVIDQSLSMANLPNLCDRTMTKGTGSH